MNASGNASRSVLSTTQPAREICTIEVQPCEHPFDIDQQSCGSNEENYIETIDNISQGNFPPLEILRVNRTVEMLIQKKQLCPSIEDQKRVIKDKNNFLKESLQAEQLTLEQKEER